MLRVRNENLEMMEFVNAKLQKDNEKLFKKLPQAPLEVVKVASDKYTLFTEENNELLVKSAIPSCVAFAVGVLKTIVGGVAYLPATATPPNEEAAAFFEQARNFGESAFNSGGTYFLIGGVLLALPAGIAAISLSNKINRMLVEKKVAKINNNNEVITLIDDLIENKEDPSLEFANNLVKKVELSGNDSKVNIQLLKLLAYHRNMVKLQLEEKVSKEEVEAAYDNIIEYLKQIYELPSTSQNFKSSRYLKIIINEYDEKIKTKMILGELPRK